MVKQPSSPTLSWSLPPRLTPCLVLVLICLSSATWGCGQEDIEIELVGPVTIDGCVVNPGVRRFPYASYSAAPDGGGLIRLQQSSGPPNVDDAFLFRISDREALRHRLEERLPLGSPSGNLLIEGVAHFAGSCDRLLNRPIGMRGSVAFTHFQGRIDSRVEATATFSLFDKRQPDVLLARDLSLHFSFTIRRYQPYQTFLGQ